MNPEELLKRVALYVSNGMPPDEAARYIAQESNGRFRDIQSLTESLYPPPAKPALTKAKEFLTGLGQNAVQGATLQFGDELAGSMAAAVPGGQDYRQARDAYRQSQEGFLAAHPMLGATAQTGGALAGMIGSGLVGGPVAAGAFLPGLIKAMGVGGLYGGVAGAGAAPEMADVPNYAGTGATNAELLTGVMGTTIPAGAWVASKGKNLFDLLRGNPATLQNIANRQVGGALANDQATGSGLPILDKMQEIKLSGVVPADAGGEAASLLRQSANKDPGLRLPLQQLVRDRQAQRAPDMASALERTRGMTQTEARAGEAQAVAAKRALGPVFDAIDNVPLAGETPAAQLIGEMRAWSRPQKSSGGAASQFIQDMNARRIAEGKAPLQVASGAGTAAEGAPPPPYGAPKIGRLVERAMRNVGDRPLTVQHARAVLNTLKDARQAAFSGPAKDRSLGPALDAQIKALEAALEASSPEFKIANEAYRQQIVAQEAFQAGRDTPKAKDPVAAMAERNRLIKEGAPETRQRMAQGSTAEWTDMLRASNPRTPGRSFTQVAGVASPRRDLAGVADPRRALWKSDFPSQQAVNQMDEAVAMADRMGQTESAMTGNSTTAAQLEGEAGGAFQLARDLVRGGNPKWGAARGLAHLMDMIRRPQTKVVAGMVGDILKQPMTPEVRATLWNLMNMEYEAQKQATALQGVQLQRAMATGAVGGSPR